MGASFQVTVLKRFLDVASDVLHSVAKWHLIQAEGGGAKNDNDKGGP
jgi:hypothetical protein